jgi:hypothetical protein
LLHVHELEQACRSLEFHQQVHVAILPRLATRCRPKKGERFDAQSLRIRPMLA